MTKVEEKKKQAMALAEEQLKDMNQEQANAFISENFKLTQITKALMAVYIKKYATSKEDQEWVKGDFKKATEKTAVKKVQTICMGGNNIPIHKYDAKNNRYVPKMVRVDSITGETYTTFDLAGARKEFIKHFGITPLATNFKVKPKREEKLFDEFGDLFS